MAYVGRSRTADAVLRAGPYPWAMRRLTRRHLLQLAGLTATATAAGPWLTACSPATGPLAAMPTRDPDFQPDLDLTLRAFADEVALLPGAATRVWRYEGSVVSGDPNSVQPIPGSYLGPIIRVRRGQKVRITFNNDLPDDDQESIIHWHGLQVPAAMDGHPHNAIAPGRSFVYEFEVIDRAGTYWFHPHPHGLTAEQVNAGLAGLFIVSDVETDTVALPAGEADLPLVIQDRVIDSDNQFVYALDMMSAMMGFLGDRVLVNGQPDLVVPVATRAYRLRMLNGSNARIYKLAWAEGDPLTVIGTDDGLLGAPLERPYVMLAPGERVELWIDLRDRDVGSELHLISQAFSGADGVGGMAGGMMHGGMAGGEQGEALPLATLRVEHQESDGLVLPETLAQLTALTPGEAVNAAGPRRIVISQRNMAWKLNGRDFEMTAVADDEQVGADTLELWEIVNDVNPQEMMDPLGMAHPFHIHGVQFQVVGRSLRGDYPELAEGYATVSAGFVDEGWKDTVLIMPGETVQLIMRFPQYPGLFVYHCHNLEHADQGMMRNYQIL